MVLWDKTKNVFRKAVRGNDSPTKLALSFSIGIFIAFSPLPGVHTLMMFLAKWLFNLNFPILFVATSFNNPWTILPFYALDYSVGYWILYSFFGWNPSAGGIIPLWVISLERIFGSGKICIWSFLIGGNVLGAIFALLSYPFILRFFRMLEARDRNEIGRIKI